MFPHRPATSTSTGKEEEQTAQLVLVELARGQPKALPESIGGDGRLNLNDMATYRAMQQLQFTTSLGSLQTSQQRQMLALGAQHYHPAPQGFPYSALPFGAPPQLHFDFGEAQPRPPLLRQGVDTSSLWHVTPNHVLPSSNPAFDSRGRPEPLLPHQNLAASCDAYPQFAMLQQQSLQRQQFPGIPQQKPLPLSTSSLSKTAPVPRNGSIEANPTVEWKGQSDSHQPPTNELTLALNVASVPTPDADSWMYKIDEIHPSPVIQETGDGSASMIRQVKPDTKSKKYPVLDAEITRYDILSGRGGRTNHHEGNMKFRRLVSKYKKAYICAQKFEKRQLVAKVVFFVRRGRGRFLQQDKNDGMWYETGDDKAYCKMAQLLREGASAASLYRELVSSAQSNQSFSESMKQPINNAGAAMKEAALEDLTNAPSRVSLESTSSDQHLRRASSARGGSHVRTLPLRKRNLEPPGN